MYSNVRFQGTTALQTSRLPLAQRQALPSILGQVRDAVTSGKYSSPSQPDERREQPFVYHISEGDVVISGGDLADLFARKLAEATGVAHYREPRVMSREASLYVFLDMARNNRFKA